MGGPENSLDISRVSILLLSPVIRRVQHARGGSENPLEGHAVG